MKSIVWLGLLVFGMGACLLAEFSGCGPDQSFTSGDWSESSAAVRHEIARPKSPDERETRRVVLDVQGTATFQQGMLPDSSYQHAGTTVWAYYPDNNYGSDPNFGFGVNGNFYWPYMKFDLGAAVPDGSQVLQAVLSMNAEDRYGSYQNGASHKVLSAWGEATLTYNNMPPDWNNQVYESIVYVNGLGWFDWDITQMTSDWVADPAGNFGLSIIPIDSLSDGDVVIWCSDDYSSVSLRPKLTVDYLLPEHRATFVSQAAPPAALTTGQQAQVWLRFRNDGADTWSGADNYKLGSQGPQDNTNWGFNRVVLPSDTPKDAEVEFSFSITAPAQAGVYSFQWQMIEEGVMWFGDLSTPVNVTVSKKANGDPCTLPSECDSGECVDSVCCDSGCAGNCMRCDLAGRLGICSYISGGQDPDGECAGEPPCGSYCDGTGGCGFPAAGIACADCATCNGAGSCSQWAASGSDAGDVCGLCRVCPGDGPDCVPVAVGSDPNGECTPATPESCGFDGNCDGQGGCDFHPQGTVCDPERCQNDIHYPTDVCDGAGSCQDSGQDACLPYVCLDASSCRTDCSLDTDCVTGSHCEGGACVAYIPRGQACSRDEECITGHCTDGVCCEVACGGPCEVCNLPVDPGGCLPVPDGQDPREDCPGTGICGGVCDGASACRFTPADTSCAPCTTCDGAGACAVFVAAASDPFDDCPPCQACSGTDASCGMVADGSDPLDDCAPSAPASCQGDGDCNGSGSCRMWPQGSECNPAACTDGLLEPADLCDGAGACQDSGQVDCLGYQCLAANACRDDCAADSDCLDGYHCRAQACEADRPTGDFCESDGQCASGHCADGVCCSSACQAACERCDLSGSLGNCTFVPAGEDPDAECGDQGICSGACDGAGACVQPGQDIACGPCARCDGQGACSVMLPAGTDPDDACGPCRVCAGDRDECISVAAGEDPLDECDQQPQNECGLDGVCDGRGACRMWVSGTACGSQSCLGDVLTLAPTCDGSGSCAQQGTLSCAPYICDGDFCAGPQGLDHVSIEDLPDGSGQPVGDTALTTDDLLDVYAVGRDAGGAYLDQIVVTWSVDGEIGTLQPGPSRSATFDPTTTGTGRLLAVFHDPAVTDGQSGILAVGPGVAAGSVDLVADPAIIPADGVSTSTVLAGPVTDEDGNLVADGTLLSVITSGGSIQGDDDDPGLDGFQRATNRGFFSFVVRAGTKAQAARLRVVAVPPGTAQGAGLLYFGDGKPVADAGDDIATYSGKSVTLDGSGSFDPYGRPIGYSWSQTDGEPVELVGADTETPSFTATQFSGSRTLTFELIVSVGTDESVPDSVDVFIQGEPDDLPVAIIVLDPDHGPAPLSVLLDGRTSSASSGATLRGFLWSFADGCPAVSGQSTSRTFDEPGGYGVTLTVTDSSGKFAAAGAQVSVFDGDNQPPLLSLRAIPGRGQAPLEVAYTAEATDADGTIDKIEWDFGGGFSAEGAEQTKLYSRPGRHTARARATDDKGLTSVAQIDVFVLQAGSLPPVILSSAPVSARVGEAYDYLPMAIGTPSLAWSLGKEIGGELLRAPAGMQTDPGTGATHWVPSSAQAGDVDVTLVVANDAGADFQDFTIRVEGSGSAGGCGCGTQRGSLPGWLAMLLLLALASCRTIGKRLRR